MPKDSGKEIAGRMSLRLWVIESKRTTYRMHYSQTRRRGDLHTCHNAEAYLAMAHNQVRHICKG